MILLVLKVGLGNYWFYLQNFEKMENYGFQF